MKINTDAIVNGLILNKYGKHGSEKRFGMPILSFPFEISDAPKKAKSFAIIFDDPDSIPMCGQAWIHWLVANLHKTKVKEDESRTCSDFIQGINSWNQNCYGGPCPPDKPHRYRITAYALSENLDLRGNFLRKQLEDEMKGKILDTAVLYGLYPN